MNYISSKRTIDRFAILVIVVRIVSDDYIGHITITPKAVANIIEMRLPLLKLSGGGKALSL